jgi:hypothetical protein
VIPYASRTGTKRNLDALRGYGWRLMVSAKGVLRTEGFRYALDNGAWHAHVRGIEFDEEAFLRALAMLGAGADWVVLPDVVAGGVASLQYSMAWAPRVLGVRRMLAVQDGMTAADVRPCLREVAGIFVGGSTEWKLATMEAWGALAHEVGKIMHVGRVNTITRIRQCAAAGATSFDGSGPSRFVKMVHRLDPATRTGDLFDVRRTA